MRRNPWLRIVGAFLLFFLAGSLSAAAAEPSILVDLSFDDGKTDTGPDTFSVFRKANGNVELSNAFRASGDRSVEIRDVAKDGDFPELQGYFPLRKEGWLVVHFAFLVVDPEEELNIALAGPGWFTLEQDGISFWLSTRDGALVHTSDSIPKRLLRLKPFTWYGVDVDYAIAAGRYDLRVYEEGVEEPVVALRDVPNASSRPGNAVSMYSFIGAKPGDHSNVIYYVDDVIIATDRQVKMPPFVAPGRRKLFVDSQPAPAPREGEPAAVRLEREGDEALRARDLREARRLYEEALRTAENPALLLKLADISYLQGDVASEKALREKIYGSLDPR